MATLIQRKEESKATNVELLGSPYYKEVPLPRIPSVHKLSRYEVPHSPTVRTRVCWTTRYVFPRGPINHRAPETIQ